MREPFHSATCMPPAAQVGHRVDGQQNREIQLRLLFRERQAQVELPAALNHVLEHLIDRILIFAGPGGDLATHLFAEAVSRRWRHSGCAAWAGASENRPLQVRIVQGRACRPIVLPLARVVLAQGLLQLGRADRSPPRVTTLGGTAASPFISPSTYCSFLSTGQPL